MAFPDKWSETAIITIAPQGGANIDLSPIIDSIDEDLGDKEVEYTANLKGGRSEKFVPEEVTTITFEGYPVTIETAPALAEHVGVLQLFHNTRGNWDTTQPMTIDCSRNREKYGLAIVWTNDTTMTSATGSNSIGNTAERTIFLNCRLVSLKMAFTDGELKTTWKVKVAPFSKGGNPNIRFQSSNGTDSSSSLGTISLGVTSLGQL